MLFGLFALSLGLQTWTGWERVLSLFAFVALTAFYVYRGSRASRDADDRLYTQLDRIEARLRTLETTATAPWVPPLHRDSLAQPLEDRDSGI